MRPRLRIAAVVVLSAVAALTPTACSPTPRDSRRVLTFSGSSVGAEGEVLQRQLARFQALHPELRIELRVTPDAADQRHQLYVQWLNAHAPEPDVLQLDVIWTPELAAAGWLAPLDPFHPDTRDFFAPALEANRWAGQLYALPWFVDVGMLYWRTDLLERPPRTFEELALQAREAQQRGGVRHGLVWQGARYEGLVCVFLEHLGGFGGAILDPEAQPALTSPQSLAALSFMRGSIEDGLVPRDALAWQEEQTRFAFQNGEAVFMRNWPYAYGLMQDAATSRVAGRFAVAPMPAAPGGSPTAALGGSQLAINASSRSPREAWLLLEFLTRPEQMRERALIAGQFPARRSLFLEALPGLAIPPKQALGIIERATPRPVTPVYTELSQILQVHLHRALTGQEGSQSALAAANEEVTALLDSIHPRNAVPSRANPWIWRGAILLLALGALIALLLRRARRRRRPTAPPGSSALHEAGLAWSLVAPALACIALTAAFPLAWTAWESLHRRDLRTPWLGAPFVGLANYLELLSSPRFWGALGRTAFFTGMSVVLELGLGLVLALGLNRAFRGRGLARAAVLLPWAVPTVVAAIIWRFMFDSRAGIAHAALADLGVVEPTFVWFVDAAGAWVPVILADVWKTTPFVALLLLAGLQSIDESLYEAAKVDGAGALSQLVYITLPLLRPALLVALLFRTLDSFRVFDLIYVLTGGGPGTATEPVSLLTFSTLLEHLRFGLGSALSMVVFGVSFLVAVLYLRVLGAELTGRAE